LTHRAPERPPRQAPIHKDLHYRHLVLGSKPAFIDLDEMRAGDPSFDLAHFCVHLDLLGLRMSMAPRQVEALKRSFLDPYSDLTGWVQQEAFTYFCAYSCLKIARQLCTRSGVRPRPRGAERRRQLQEIVSKGVSLAGALG
jgi:aminoglycoside phosphotransferase (APT) family kinase protein